MPRYFFDSYDGKEAVSDQIGLELPDIEQAKAYAIKALAELAVEVLPGSSGRRLSVDIKNDECRVLLRIQLSLDEQTGGGS